MLKPCGSEGAGIEPFAMSRQKPELWRKAKGDDQNVIPAPALVCGC
jgi:hypothetical protein